MKAKQIRLFIGLGCFLLHTLTYASYLVGVCYNAKKQWTAQYACFANSWWGGNHTLWVKQNMNPGTSSMPSSLCEKNTGHVFNSQYTVLEECTQVDQGQWIEYTDF